MNVFTHDCLVGRRILVTGASSGIGRATAILLSQCGAQVTLSGRDSGRLTATRQLLQGSGHPVHSTSLTDADHVADWLKSLAQSEGPFDGIFHAAGIVLIKPARLIKQAHLDAVLGSSLMASFGIARAVAQKGTVNDGASVVLMSSVAGSRGQPGNAAYSAAKAGIEGLVRSLACELATRSIRVNAIAAGAVETEMHGEIISLLGVDGISNYMNQHLLGFGNVQDIANGATFLLSPASIWITGTSMVVDGGYMVR